MQVFADEPIYLLSGAHPDERLLGLEHRRWPGHGCEVDDVVHDFGVFNGGTTFTRRSPAFFAIPPSARDFSLTVETRIHERSARRSPMRARLSYT